MIQHYGTISCFMKLNSTFTYDQIIVAINNFREQTYYYKELVIVNESHLKGRNTSTLVNESHLKGRNSSTLVNELPINSNPSVKDSNFFIKNRNLPAQNNISAIKDGNSSSFNSEDYKRVIEYISKITKNYIIYNTMEEKIAPSTFNGNIILCETGNIELTSGKYFVHWTPYQWSNPSRLFFQVKYLHDNKMDICCFSKIYTYNNSIEDSTEYENAKQGKYSKEILMADRVKYIKNKISQENFFGGDDQKYYIYIKDHAAEPVQSQQQSYFYIIMIAIIAFIIILLLFFILKNTF